MQENNNNADVVSPATTLPWPFSAHSDEDYHEKTKVSVEEVVPGAIPGEIAILSGQPADDVLSVDTGVPLVGIARLIEAQNRLKEAESERIIEEARVAEEEQLRILELEEAGLKAANAKKRKNKKAVSRPHLPKGQLGIKNKQRLPLPRLSSDPANQC
jgi:hypothetical protein